MISPHGTGAAFPSGGDGLRWDAATLLKRGHLAIFITLILLTLGAWGLTIRQAQSMASGTELAGAPVGGDDQNSAMGDMNPSGQMEATAPPDRAGMAEMAPTGWSLSGLGAFVVAWAVMMAAMMLPAVAPMLLLYRTLASRSMSSSTAFASTWILVAGYLLVWTMVGAVIYALTRLGGELADRLDVAESERWAPLLMGAIVVVAGLYQFTPLKHTCLRQCQSPFGFLMGHWRDGKRGALRMGVVHGVYCLGCCWALFAVLVVTGIMSLAWMLLLTLVVFTEKVLPVGRRTAQAVGGAFVVLGVLVASGTIPMPWIV